MSDHHVPEDPNAPATPLPEPAGFKDGRGTAYDSRTPPPVARTRGGTATSTMRLVILGAIVFVVVVAILIASQQ
jgi:hypothetical protein